MIIFRGTIVHSIGANDPIQILLNSILGYDENTGEIKFIQINVSDDDQQLLMKNLQRKHGCTDENWKVIALSSSQFLMPGMVDTHIHAPQYRYTGTGYDKNLLEWLKKYTFPTEAMFKDTEFAKDVYSKVVARTLSHGTTTASYFATIYLESTKELCRIIASQGQRALVGKVNMDNPKTCPEFYVESTEDSIKKTVEFIEFVDQMRNPLIRPVITPRFAISCTKKLLNRLGEIAATKNLPIQTHLCEQVSEVEFTMSLFPGNTHYTDIYDKAGLVTDKSYFAHCVHLQDAELDVLKKKDAGLSHCPNSNICLKSGLMNTHALLKEGVHKLGLGTDVAGGYHPSIFDSLRMAVTTSKACIIGTKEGESSDSLISHHEAFFMATLGGAKVLGLDKIIGNFEVGKQFDALLIDTAAPSEELPVFDVFPGEPIEDKLSKFLYLGDDRNIVQVFVNGKMVSDKLKNVK